MYDKFVQTSNVKRFLAAVATADQRAAREAGWIAAIGEPGLGKTKTLENWAGKEDVNAVYLRSKANWTSTWVMQELAGKVLGVSNPLAKGSYRVLFQRVMESLGESQKPIIVDEVEKTGHNPRLLEGIRDIVDMTDIVLVLGGTPDALKFLQKQPQWASRVYVAAPFQKATVEDVRLMADQLSQAPLADDLVALIHDKTRGYFREIKNAIGEAERVGRSNPDQLVTAEMLKGRDLCRNRTALAGGASGGGWR